MEKIASFKVNHLNLISGIYISRIDSINENFITTYDLRYLRPNKDLVMTTSGMHTIEHLGATFLRNREDIKDEVIYFGPMGCRTGFYLILKGNRSSKEIFPLIREMNEFILEYSGKIPGCDPRDCGNYLDLNLDEAKKIVLKYKNDFLDFPHEEQFIYPD